MSEHAALEFLTTLQTQFRVKRHESEEHEAKWVSMMVDELEGYSPQILEQAAKNLIRKRRNEYFPVLSECLAACEEAKRWIDAATPKLQLGKPGERASPFSEDRMQLADDLVMGEMGRQAAREGWILALHDSVMKTGRLPDSRHIPQLKAQVHGFQEALDKCRAGNFPLAGVLVELGISMLQRREQLTDMVLHGVARR